MSELLFSVTHILMSCSSPLFSNASEEESDDGRRGEIVHYDDLPELAGTKLRPSHIFESPRHSLDLLS